MINRKAIWFLFILLIGIFVTMGVILVTSG